MTGYINRQTNKPFATFKVHEILRARLLNTTFAKYHADCKAKEEYIAARHSAALGLRYHVYKYRGELYPRGVSIKNFRLADRVKYIVPLDPSLEPEMAAMAKEARAIENTYGQLRHFYATVIMFSPVFTDYYRVLPDFLHPTLDNFTNSYLQDPIPLGTPIPDYDAFLLEHQHLYDLAKGQYILDNFI